MMHDHMKSRVLSSIECIVCAYMQLLTQCKTLVLNNDTKIDTEINTALLIEAQHSICEVFNNLKKLFNVVKSFIEISSTKG